MATSKFLRTFRTVAGVPITTATIWLVPQANTYPTGALALTPHATRDGQYYRDNVPDGEYKIYIDPAGGSSPTLYEEEIWIGEARITTISDHFDSADSYKLKTTGIKDVAVTAALLATDAVETAKIKDSAVTLAKLAANSVDGSKIVDLSITANELAADSVIGSKILDAQVSTSKIVDLNVTTAKINTGAVTVDKLGTDAVETAKIKDYNVTVQKLKGNLFTDVLAAKPLGTVTNTARPLATNDLFVIEDVSETTGADRLRVSKMEDVAFDLMRYVNEFNSINLFELQQTITYDSLGRVSVITYKHITTLVTYYTETIAYDSLGRVSTITTSMAVKNPVGYRTKVSTIGYDANGNAISITNAIS